MAWPLGAPTLILGSSSLGSGLLRGVSGGEYGAQSTISSVTRDGVSAAVRAIREERCVPGAVHSEGLSRW